MPSWLVSTLINALLMAAVAGGLWYEKSAYDTRRRAEGYVQGWSEGRDKLIPQLKADEDAFREITGYMQAISANSTILRERVAAAQKSNGQRQIVERERIQYIDRVVPTGETECLRTTDAIQKVLR